MKEKITKKKMFNLIMDKLADHQDIVEFCAHEIELLDNKKKSSSKANEKTEYGANIVYNALVSAGKPMTVSELIAKNDFDELKNDNGVVSTQKVSALLKKCVDIGKVSKFMDKKTTYFQVINND